MRELQPLEIAMLQTCANAGNLAKSVGELKPEGTAEYEADDAAGYLYHVRGFLVFSVDGGQAKYRITTAGLDWLAEHR